MSIVTEKNTKAEILKAYNALLKKVQEEKENVPKQLQEEKRKNETLSKVSDMQSASIVSNITAIKDTLSNSLEELLSQLLAEFKSLEDIRAAIAIEKQSLEDIYSLSATTDSLATMLLVQKEQKEQFEKELSEAKAQWEQEKAQQKVEDKEYNDELNKRRKREEEEFQYALKVVRQKDKDQYEAQKEALEKELKVKLTAFEADMVKREDALKNAETELSELRKKNADFPTQLEKAVADKEKAVTEQLELQHDFELKFLKQQSEADIKLKEQTITSLYEKIKEQQDLIKEYSEKTNRAEAGVKDIAVKAIENAARSRTMERVEVSKE